MFYFGVYFDLARTYMLLGICQNNLQLGISFCIMNEYLNLKYFELGLNILNLQFQLCFCEKIWQYFAKHAWMLLMGI
jgi:hypothetical protein